MKITKRQLRRIIREEHQKLINESAGVTDDTIKELESVLVKAYREMIGAHPGKTKSPQLDASSMRTDAAPHQDVTGSIMEIVEDILNYVEHLA